MYILKKCEKLADEMLNPKCKKKKDNRFKFLLNKQNEPFSDSVLEIKKNYCKSLSLNSLCLVLYYYQ